MIWSLSPGWPLTKAPRKMRDRVFSSLALGLIITSAPVFAEQSGSAESQPSAAFLEYLGQLEATQTGYIGPELFDDNLPDEGQEPATNDDNSTLNTEQTPTMRVINHD
jgi:hypothetical protein